MNLMRSVGYEQYIKSSSTWSIIRKEVLRRDNKECQCCGRRGNLDVHHRLYSDDVCSGKALHFLISLCRDCHLYVEYDGSRKIKGKAKETRLAERMIGMGSSTLESWVLNAITFIPSPGYESRLRSAIENDLLGVTAKQQPRQKQKKKNNKLPKNGKHFKELMRDAVNRVLSRTGTIGLEHWRDACAIAGIDGLGCWFKGSKHVHKEKTYSINRAVCSLHEFVDSCSPGKLKFISEKLGSSVSRNSSQAAKPKTASKKTKKPQPRGSQKKKPVKLGLVKSDAPILVNSKPVSSAIHAPLASRVRAILGH